MQTSDADAAVRIGWHLFRSVPQSSLTSCRRGSPSGRASWEDSRCRGPTGGARSVDREVEHGWGGREELFVTDPEIRRDLEGRLPGLYPARPWASRSYAQKPGAHVSCAVLERPRLNSRSRAEASRPAPETARGLPRSSQPLSGRCVAISGVIPLLLGKPISYSAMALPVPDLSRDKKRTHLYHPFRH
jgi:hypothetical protein